MEQRAIPLEGDWHILCNPRPILAPHFTVPTLRHQPQSIEAGISTMLNLAREMGEDYVLFYNGPQCGASAPDHMHLQAVPRNQTPLIDQLDLPDSASTEPNIEWAFRGHIPFGISREPFLPLALWFGDSADSLVENIRHAIHILARIHPQPNGNEPLLNAFSWYRSGNWLFGIFPRAKHRPACYGTGTGQILLSPGTLDLLGRIVTPRHQDYQYLEDQRVEEILKEVCLPGNGVDNETCLLLIRCHHPGLRHEPSSRQPTGTLRSPSPRASARLASARVLRLCSLQHEHLH
jgi:ATP adenylyltransferase/5',5'''-P-1,P-4-tetraphosphate phosphorylase II